MGRERRKWTAEEQSQLCKAVDKATQESRPLLWHEIAKRIPGRSNKDCRRRWCNTLANGATKGSWTESEDERLSDAVQEYGSKWTQVAALVGTRNSDQCSSHWSQTLNPDINYSDWTKDEDERLLLGVQKYGTNWTKIASALLSNRTRLSLKNRYSALMRAKSDKAPNVSQNSDRPRSSQQESSPKQDFAFSNFSKPTSVQTNQQALPNSLLRHNGMQQPFNPLLADSGHRPNEFRDPKSYSNQIPFGFSQNRYLDDQMTLPGADNGFGTPSAPLQFYQTPQTQDVQSGPDLASLDIDSTFDIIRKSSDYTPQTNQVEPLTEINKPFPVSQVASPQSATAQERPFPSQNQIMLGQGPGKQTFSHSSSNLLEMDVSSERSTPSISSSDSDEDLQHVGIELECTSEKLGDIMRELSRLSKTVTVKVNP